MESKLLVIDASVAGAASEKEHPRSSACRKTLDSALAICHRIVFCKKLLQEWKEHKGRYASCWLDSMLARRKVQMPKDTDQPQNELPAGVQLNEKELEAYKKDSHLLEVALTSDKIIITLDDNLIDICRKIRKYSAIRFINPEKEPDAVCGL